MKEDYDLLKISGETLSGQGKMFFGPDPLDFIVQEILEAHQEGPSFGIVVGGGNLIRGTPLKTDIKLRDTVVADNCGMLATVINAMILQDKLEAVGLPVRVMTATEMKEYGELFIRRRAIKFLREGEIVILAGGTGNPGFSTDSAAVLRAFELRARMMLKGTKVDGVYASDPVGAPQGSVERYHRLTYDQYMQRKLKALDTHAVSQAESMGVPIRVFDIFEKGSYVQVRKGQGRFTDIGPA